MRHRLEEKVRSWEKVCAKGLLLEGGGAGNEDGNVCEYEEQSDGDSEEEDNGKDKERGRGRIVVKKSGKSVKLKEKEEIKSYSETAITSAKASTTFSKRSQHASASSSSFSKLVSAVVQNKHQTMASTTKTVAANTTKLSSASQSSSSFATTNTSSHNTAQQLKEINQYQYSQHQQTSQSGHKQQQRQEEDETYASLTENVKIEPNTLTHIPEFNEFQLPAVRPCTPLDMEPPSTVYSTYQPVMESIQENTSITNSHNFSPAAPTTKPSTTRTYTYVGAIRLKTSNASLKQQLDQIKTEASDKAKTELNLLSGDSGTLPPPVPPKNHETEEVIVQVVGSLSKETDKNMQTQTETRVLNQEGYVVSQEMESIQKQQKQQKQQQQKQQQLQQPPRASTPSPKRNRLSTALSISAVAAALRDPSTSPAKSKSSHAKSRSPTPTKVQGRDRGSDEHVVVVSKMEWEYLHDEKLELEMALKKVQGILNLKGVAGGIDGCVGSSGSPSRSPLPLAWQVEEILGTLNTWQRTVVSVATSSTSTTAMTATTTTATSSSGVVAVVGDTYRFEELEVKIAELEARLKESERDKKVMYTLDEVQERVEEAMQEVEADWERKWEERERELKDSVVVEDEKDMVGDDGIGEGKGNSGRVHERFVIREVKFNGRYAAERRRYVRDNVQGEEGEEGGEEVDVELLLVCSTS
jgi:hypothetical protein